MADRLGIYLDESATDGGSPVAVVAGILLNWNQYAWLDIEWEKAIKQFGLKAIHVRKIGPAGDLAGVPEGERRALFAQLAKIINENKGWSIAATLSSDEFKAHFGWLGERGWSIYATCFLLAAVLVGKQLDYEEYPYDVPYLMDDGNSYKREVERVHQFILSDSRKSRPYHCGSLDFKSDEKYRALQAADVIAWTVRRKRARDPFRNGFEPLEDIFLKDHIEQPFEPAWMAEVSDGLRKIVP
jgi:hypothetical protein